MVNLKKNDYNKAPAFLLMVCFFLHLRDFSFSFYWSCQMVSIEIRTCKNEGYFHKLFPRHKAKLLDSRHLESNCLL